MAQHLLASLQVSPRLCTNRSEQVHRAELAQALNLLLFADLLTRVPDAARYVNEVTATGAQIVFDHGALRTVLAPSCGELPAGEAAFTRILQPLGFRCTGTYPLPRLRMTGRAYTQQELPEDIAQYFVSELHPESFSPAFQAAVGRVLATSRDPLDASDQARLDRLADTAELPLPEAELLLPKLLRCFARQHALPTLSDYELLLAESAEMAWISTEGNAFNHATDRVPDVHQLAAALRERGYPMKDTIEVSANQRVRQTAFRAAAISYQLGSGAPRQVPGSFYEFISRDRYSDASGPSRLDLTFDASNATGIFKMTAAT